MSFEARRRIGLAIRALVALGLAFGPSLPVRGQDVSFAEARLEGRVATVEGRALAGSRVKLRGAEERETVTSSQGLFVFGGLLPGEYSIDVALEDYISSWVEGIDLRQGETFFLRFELERGRSSSVTVTSMPVIDATTASSRWNLNRDQLELLPTGGVLDPLLSLRPRPSPVALVDGVPLGRLPSKGRTGRLPPAFFEETLALSLVRSASFGSTSSGAIDLRTRKPLQQWQGEVELRLGAGEESDLARGGLAEGDLSGSRSVAVVSGPLNDRLRGFLGGALFRERTELPGQDEPNTVRRDTDSYVLRLDWQAAGRLVVSGLHLRDESETRLSAPIASEVGHGGDVTRVSVLAGPRQDLELGLLIAQVGEQALERVLFGVSEVDTDAEARTFAGRAAWWRASLLLEGGVAHSEDDQEARGSSSGGAWRFTQERQRALWLQPRWRLGRVSVQTAVRHQRMKSDSLTRGTMRHDELLPRLALAWDPMGDGQWNLFASATESAGRLPGDGSNSDRSPSSRFDTVRRYSLGFRHQLLPGVVIDFEAEQRRFESDDRAEKLARDWLRPRHLLARCAERQQGARLGVHARLGLRLVAGFDYDYSEMETAQPCSFSGSADLLRSMTGRYLIGTPEPLLDHLHRYRWLATLKLENGLEAGATLRLSYGIAPRIRTEQVSPDRLLVSSSSSDQNHSLTELDLALGYRWQIAPSLGRNTMGITARLELLNALGGDATLTYLPQIGDSAPQPLTAQAPRQLWLGIRLDL